LMKQLAQIPDIERKIKISEEKAKRELSAKRSNFLGGGRRR